MMKFTSTHSVLSKMADPSFHRTCAKSRAGRSLLRWASRPIRNLDSEQTAYAPEPSGFEPMRSNGASRRAGGVVCAAEVKKVAAAGGRRRVSRSGAEYPAGTSPPPPPNAEGVDKRYTKR
jgi:hypothetical protein